MIERLEALRALGYVAGVGAVDGEGIPISFRISGFGVDTTVAADDEEALASIEQSHHNREVELGKTDEEREAETVAVTEQREQRRDALVAKVNGSNLPAALKEVLVELIDARFGLTG